MIRRRRLFCLGHFPTRPRAPTACSNGRQRRSAMEIRSELGSRRVFLIASLSVGVAWAAGRVSGARAACGGDGALTPPQTEGPYFKPSSPARASLIEPGMPGTTLVVEGSVLTAD